jgi:Protein of unknown function (DUF3558)
VSSRPAVVALAGFIAAATLAGCTTSQAGQAEPTTEIEPSSAPPSRQPTGTATSSARPTVAIPPRPRELRLDGIDPCTLFTRPQLSELKVNRSPRSITAEGASYKGMRQCVLNVQNEPPFYRFNIIAVTNEGIEAWLTGKRNVEAKLSSVAGYAAATYWLRGANGRNTDGCTTSVDVASGQQLYVDTNNDGGHSFTLEQLCQRAEGAAALAVQTLQTLK